MGYKVVQRENITKNQKKVDILSIKICIIKIKVVPLHKISKVRIFATLKIFAKLMKKIEYTKYFD